MEHPVVIDSEGRISLRRRRRFTIIDRAVQRARDEIMAQEDAEIFRILDEIAGNKEE